MEYLLFPPKLSLFGIFVSVDTSPFFFFLFSFFFFFFCFFFLVIEKKWVDRKKKWFPCIGLFHIDVIKAIQINI